MNAENIKVDEKFISKYIDFSDEWINSRFHHTLQQLNDAMERFEINNATKIIYSYVWNDFCDWYIELMKNRLYAGDEAASPDFIGEIKSAVLSRAIKNFENLLKIVHPFMPFITEELWQLMAERKKRESILTSDYPKFDLSKINSSAEKEMEFVQDVITALRNIRGEMNIAPSKQVKAFIKSSEVRAHQVDYIKKLAKVDKITIDKNLVKPKASASAVIKETEIYVPLGGLIDLDVERSRLQKEITRLEDALIGIDKKLSNEKFIQNAAPEVVEKERAKKKDLEKNLIKLHNILSNLN
jgi:valyl-tRNA synthetase